MSELTHSKPIDLEAQPQTQALARREEYGAVGKPLSVEQIHERLQFIRNVMRQEMKEDQDYGRIPGTGEKPTLLQPGAQKLLLTFQLREQVIKETLRELPNPSVPGHREYEFTVSVFPAGQAPEQGWHGVGTCSTMEAKYRFRKAERKCPVCGHAAIIPENPQFLKPGQVAGFLCWKKKGGCGKTFAPGDPTLPPPAGRVEHDNPADYFNTVRKMAFKRALVAAAINATNTSELWTQDLDDNAPDDAPEPPGACAPSNHTPRARPAAPAPVSAPAQPPPRPFPTAKTRDWMIKEGEMGRGKRGAIAQEYFEKLAQLLPTETVEQLPLRFVPSSTPQLKALLQCIDNFEAGGEILAAFKPNPEPDSAPKPRKGSESPSPASQPSLSPRDPEWFFDIVVPIPPKGEKRDEYLKHPDTIQSLYDARHTDEQARKRLFGFAGHFQPAGWTKHDGTQMPPSAADLQFREALDAFSEWYEKHKDDADQAPTDATNPDIPF